LTISERSERIRQFKRRWPPETGTGREKDVEQALTHFDMETGLITRGRPREEREDLS